MATRRDQLHSYQFHLQRVVSALVMRETDPAQSPFRRVAGAVLASVLFAVIGLAIVGIYGLIVPGGKTDWKDGKAVIVEKETGARYVWLKDSQRLHPVVNYASALLLLEGPNPEPVRVSRSSLEGQPRGNPVGIPGAPDSLPAKGALLGAPWSLCSATVKDEGGQSEVRSVLTVGAAPTGGRTLDAASPGEVVLARQDDKRVFAIWRHRKYEITGKVPKVLSSVSWDGPITVAPALLNALPSGSAPFGLPKVDGLGAPAKIPALRGARVGTVYTLGDQFYLARADALVEISETQAMILLGDPDVQAALGQKEATKLTPGDRTNAQPTPLVADGKELIFEKKLPRIARPPADRALCAVFGEADQPTSLVIDADVPVGGLATGRRTQAGSVLADQVVVKPGRGALVDGGSAQYVVSDLGIRYAVRGDAVRKLGFEGVTPLRVPASLIAMLPTGRVLDPRSARSPAVSTE